MLLTIAAILVILWLLGFTLSVGGWLIHLLIIIALIVFIYDMVVRRRAK